MDNIAVGTIRKRDILPNKPSELLFLALKDMQTMKKNKDFKFNMGMWHRDFTKIKGAVFKGCYICMAGAVMANTLKAPRYKETQPLSYKNQKIENKLRAIDSLRAFNVNGALLNLLDNAYYDKIDKLKVIHKIPDLQNKTGQLLANYKLKKEIFNSDGIFNHAQEHMPLYKKYAKLLEKAGL